MDVLIRMMSRIDDVLETVGSGDVISLPQIVAIGSQSSGKSSVLENIVGRDFIPRNSGVCTRRPLKLDLIKVDRTQQVEGRVYEEWAVFAHLPDKVFTDWNEVGLEIVRETERLCGNNKNICDTQIGLRVFSPHVVSLTLIDLPGITRVPVGDQPEDIEDQIVAMVTKYIKRPNTLILAVTAANVDFATSEAIKLARKVDPLGKRTLAVLTKIDLMDRGTDAMDVISGRVLPVKLGIVGIMCRSQADLNKKTTIREALEKEKKFFRSKYPSVAARSGSAYLRRSLSKLLVEHIRATLPELTMKISLLRRQFQSQLAAYGEPQILRLEEPSIRCIELVQEELKRIINDALSAEYQRFPRLSNKLRDAVISSIEMRTAPAKEFISNFIKNEVSYINCKHPDFLGAKKSAISKMTGDSEQATEKRECAIVEFLIQCYFNIVRKSIQDHVPKVIMNFIVNAVKDSLQGFLVTTIYKTESGSERNMKELLAESEFIAQQREELTHMLQAYSQAEMILQSVRNETNTL
ncbi:Oidioi.mRNA.OKI2018_I69.PAR.g12036.t1.cds [Oikopleura dioica]|uniref:Oidioi.mRNA.OKI2018_I69.PAR.g12036.t1.cds n=1 Tax=Oikopleura dioica TaxID=34765 RepID=A0ABN7S390_OIKDI|nr:Oidioi.mRNA.OKI2018_I69.PAR.g12036.t1.cds [Oikopleura dioica]